ncbi:MAG: tetratricopeptide repeat protein [Gemmatimonadaceae bacterium]|jgi:tetratricopeptide (TPR) repeat protein
MADSAIGLERTFDATTYTPVTGGERLMDRGSRASAQSGGPETSPAKLVQLVSLAVAKQDAGEDADAQELFRQALEIADRTLGPDDPDVVLLLTDLTRLYLRKSAFESAEPLLLRLFEIKRSKGEDHAEVATVLASLATVRQALGRHESAEQLWRRVLEIRELTLAPNHFAIATALEHLGNSCGARGKIAEALSAFQRALSIREKTLGPEHPSLRVSRERIADLRLQGSEDSFDLGLPSDAVVAPEKYRLLSGEPRNLAGPRAVPQPRAFTEARNAVAPEPVPQKERVSARVSKKAPPVIPERLDDVLEDDEPSVPALSIVSQSASVAVALPHSVGIRPEAAPYLDTLDSLREELEQPYEARNLTERSGEMISAAMAFLGRKEAIVGMVALTLGLLAVVSVTDSQTAGDHDQVTGAASAPAAETPRLTTNLPAVPVSTNAPATAAAMPVEISSKTAANRPRPIEDHSSASKKAPEKKIDVKPLTIPALSTAVISRIDSLAAKAGNNSSPIAESMFAPTPAQMSIRQSGLGESEAAAPIRARLIGDLPTPRIPQQVADVEGEVRVRFSVDTDGKPVMATFDVVTSPNPLLTSAVRKVIPTLRFEPARTGGADPKAIVDVVQIGFQFSKGK